jgi:hypothetical protein
MNTKNIVGILAATAGLLMFGTANAAWIACSSEVAGSVSNTSDCTVSTTLDQDNTNPPLVVNSDGGAFGGGWNFIQKFELEGVSGNWTAPASMYSEIMIVFKNGSTTFLTGFLTTNSTGTWDTNLFSGKSVSHYTFYGRNGVEVSEPAILGLLGLGLFGLAFARRRKV